ncbi:LysM peptidoglycan-binding domain-containing protein [Rhodopseudomonas sp. WA056]|uniref:Peptidase M23 n=1 Tax=Rhodopseudomonas palustris (strain DX-1) TaxID=652103 RepID=E6VHQ7_RHOPX|nr:peptidoglycan DD-metalloendopeptidase family protein [Rhodopseudomonas sp. WA056]NEW87260.1 LysM peptidoglycan-binding domain-containing protein [Rhodopseudomonas sp. WA056]
MSRVAALLCSRRAPQVAVLALMSVGFSACSADMQTRFQQAPFGPVESTGSVARQPQRQELPQYARPQYQQPQYQQPYQPQYQSPQYQSQALPPISAPPSYPVAGQGAGVSGGGRGVASYEPPPRAPIESTGTVQAPRSVAAARPMPAAPAPAPAAGTTIIVGTSDTLEILAQRYRVSTAEILRANGYKGPRRLQPGQQLVIPSRATTAQAAAPVAAPAAVPPAPRPVATAAPAPTASRVHYVNNGDTLINIARRNNLSLGELARYNNLTTTTKLKPGMKINVPTAQVAAAAPAQPQAPAPAAAPAAAPVRMASVAPTPAEPAQKARMVAPTETPESAAPADASPVKAAEATGALPSFRWPARGRVIAAYGAKTNGKSNDGINLSVPEGTPVKAAEDGVVAYAGSELKGYGNLVLIRHSNGYVSAYAHASELMVKRGESIKRGQVIAKSGQSGDVSSPQLHFEIRKGSTPVDPLKFLNGA